MDQLEQAFRHLKSLPFPSVPDDEDLASIVSRMSELDSQLSSLAATAGRGNAITPAEVPPVHGLVNRLRDINGLTEQDADIYAGTVDYLEALASLRSALLEA